MCVFAHMSMCVCKSTCVLNLDFVLDAGLYFTYKCVYVCVHAYVCARVAVGVDRRILLITLADVCQFCCLCLHAYWFSRHFLFVNC